MADNQPRDEHAKHLKQTASTVKQLRGWVASDPTRTEEFVDALNAVTGLRLLSRTWTDAAPEAAEAVNAADKLVASRGPVGPYTPAVDAARYFTALTHVSCVQHGMNLAAPAAATIGAAFGWKDQLTNDGLAHELDDRTACWAMIANSRAAHTRGDLAAANAWADAALGRARRSEFAGDELPILLEALRADADARFAVGLTDQAIELDREAVEAWKAWTKADLDQLPRMAKPHLERLVATVVPLRRDLADRLAHAGRTAEAAAVLDEHATLLHRTAARRGEGGRVDLALARADQAWTLTDQGRHDEALRAGEDAQQALQALFKVEKPVGSHLPTQLAVAPALARAQLAAGRPEQARVGVEALANRLRAHKAITVAPAAVSLALLVRAEVLQALGDQAGADVARAEAASTAATLRNEALVQQHNPHADDLTLLRARARGVILPSEQPTPHWEVPDAVTALAPSGVEAPQAVVEDDEAAMRRIDEIREREAAERAEAERIAAAERAERERRQAEERAAALAEYERQRAEREQREAAERAAAEEQARLEAERLAAEQAERSRIEAERLVALREAQEQVAREAALAEAASQEMAEQAVPNAKQHEELVEHERDSREQSVREAERLEQERLAAERAEQERLVAQEAAQEAARAEAEAVRLEQERQAREEQEAREAEERQRLEQERVEQERLERERREQEQARAVDPLDALREAARDAVASGSKDRIVASHEQLVAALEPRAAVDPHALGAELVGALERLSDAQGWLRGRAAGKRAKQLARQWGLG